MAKKTEDQFIWGTGRRKTAVARVRMKSGSGKISINKKDYKSYFGTLNEQLQVIAPLRAVDELKKYDIFVNATGGGYGAQADAISLGIARALLKVSADHEPILRDGKFLTRDSREVERKKPGRPGARRSFQFSKR